LDVVGSRAEIEAMVIDDLEKLDAIDAKISAVASSQGGLKRIDDIEFYEGQVVSQIQADARRRVGRLSTTLGVPIVGDAFGSDGYLGDNWSRSQTQIGGMFSLG
jgi:hypothetical protein